MLNGLAPWFGAKRAQVANILPLLGDHSSYWELFAGSMAVILAKKPSVYEAVNDLHDGIANLAVVVRSSEKAPQLHRMLSATPFSERLYGQSCSRLPGYRFCEEGDVEYAYDYFVASWMGRNGLAGTSREDTTGLCVRFTNTGGDPAVRFRHAVESIGEWHRRLARVTVLHRDAIELASRLGDDPGRTIYADPPYLVEGCIYKHTLSVAQHEELARQLTRFRLARVVVSYYQCAELEGWYLQHGWSCLSSPSRRFMGGGDRGVAPEVLLVNQAVAKE